MPTDAAELRRLLSRPNQSVVLPCCYDGLTARLVERAGFECTFMTGFGVSAVHGFPDTQLVSYEEMAASARRICGALRDIPCIGDGDTGYGNAVNVKRTVRGYIQAGMAGIMLEDQVLPKRCGHTKGKQIVSRDEAFMRIRAAVDARREAGRDIVIVARTDARATDSLEEAIARCEEFHRLGADVTFLEAPQSVEELREVAQRVPGWRMANMLEHGVTPLLPAAELTAMGFHLIAYPLTVLGASIKAMNDTLAHLRTHGHTPALLASLPTFNEIKADVGFDEYYAEEDKYRHS
ncbi:carboxyvinyl-carboxyphosphonate phosphorylmutase [Achlya hypogyna]|uniref:Carboxyvinyl-carboxyphosphonate phosphorylmutase n=1 Tax=Achlya hypogyna TaxID=1202772 RepID=A0A1V9YZS8_ACHHY|nr:carboxyvinyl-carboxyphosphonate phosphorylmutase [Achlya hypogyna]